MATERRRLPWLRALVVHPALAVLGTLIAFAVLAIVDASGDAAVTLAYLAPLSAATLATGLAVMRRGRGPVAGFLLSVCTALVVVLILGTLLLALIVIGATSDSLTYD